MKTKRVKKGLVKKKLLVIKTSLSQQQIRGHDSLNRLLPIVVVREKKYR
jgi:hypothetical protein